MEFIKIDNISFSYANDSEVFKNFSFSVDQGECVVLRGDNGSGKTTLFKILNGLVFPNTGSFVFDGKAITEKYMNDNTNSKLFHKRVGYLFQNPDVMLFNARVFDEVAFGPRQMGLAENEVRERAMDCINLLGIENLVDKAPYHLSGGQKKKVAIAAVLALNPEVLILDEPLAGMDATSQQKMIKLILELKAAGKTLIIATHSSELEQQVADRVVHL